MTKPLIIIGIILAASFLFKALHSKQFPPEHSASCSDGARELPYRRRHILTNVEYRFYKALKPICDSKGYLILPKIGLKDLFDVTAKEDHFHWFGKISQKHVDFVICDCTLHPLFAIELDDSSHNTLKALKNDTFKDTLFRSCCFPLYRVPATKEYSEEYIRRFIDML